MAVREPFWGLVQQNGPWSQTPKDIRQARERQPLWNGGGVETGGTAHAGNGGWRSVTNFDRQRSSFMPAPPPPTKYATPTIIDNNKPYPRGYLPDMPGFEDYQKVLDEESNAIKNDLGITDHVPYLYPHAGAFERSLDLLSFAQYDELSFDPTINKAIQNAKAEETMDMMAGGMYKSSTVKPNVISQSEENIIHLDGGEGKFDIHVYRPPKLGLQQQAFEASNLGLMMDADDFNPFKRLESEYSNHSNHLSKF